MRLLYVCSDFGIPPSGTKGASVHLRAITRALADLGHEVDLLSPLDGPNPGHPAGRLLDPGCPPVKSSVKMLKHWLRDRDLDDTVGKELRPLLYNAWVRDHARQAAAMRPPAVIIERLSLLGHVGLDVAEALDVPLVVEVNALLTEEARQFRDLALHGLAEQIEQRVLQRADAILTVSQPLARKLAELGIAAEKIHVVPNGVDLDMFDKQPPREVCRAALGLRDEFVVGFCGSLKTWHGVDLLVAALPELLAEDPSARLLIVGSGPAEEALRCMARDMAIAGSVIFTGAVPHERVPELLGAMDVAVAPFRSMRRFYFSPIKLFEYMAAGACVIAPPLGQIEHVLEDGVNGFFCPPDDSQALAAVLAQVRTSGELRRRCGDRARDTVRQRYTWPHAAEATMNVVHAVLRGGASSARQAPAGGAKPLEVLG